MLFNDDELTILEFFYPDSISVSTRPILTNFKEFSIEKTLELKSLEFLN
jgi:hypothetical protein